MTPRRIAALVVVAALVMVASASTADTLTLTLVSQNNTTITLGWTPQAGYGYLFSADGMLQSRTNDASRSTVKFSKSFSTYEVAVIVKGATGTYPTAPPPPADTQPPTVSMTAPADGATISGTINVSANAADNVGVTRVDFYRDLAVIGSDTTAPYSISDNTALLTNGAHGYGARAYDAAGNEGLAVPVHNTVSNGTPPPVTQCSDGIDNDGDGKVDLADPGCSSASDNDETDPVAGACAKTTPNVPDGPDGMGGCFPGPSSTGVPAGTTLTTHSGSCVLSSGTYDAQTFNCDPEISGLVTITRSRVNGSIQVHSAGNLTISDSYVDASPNGPRETRAIWNDENGTVTIDRNELVGGNGTVWCNKCTIRDSYVHGQEIQGSWHASAVRADQNSTVIHNSLWCEAQPTPQDGGCSADLTGYPDFQPTHHWTIERNLFMANSTGNAWCAYGGGTTGKPYSNNSQNATYIVFRDNVFQRGPNGKCGSFDPITDFITGRVGNVWSGNVWDNGGTVPPG